MPEEKLKPCPFDCGGTVEDVSLEKIYIDSYFVRCNYCGANGESCGTGEQAMMAWNRRSGERK